MKSVYYAYHGGRDEKATRKAEENGEKKESISPAITSLYGSVHTWVRWYNKEE